MFQRPKKQMLTITVAPESDYGIYLTNSTLNEHLALAGITQQSLFFIAGIQPHIAVAAEAITNSFYDTLEAIPELAAIINEHSSSHKLRGTFHRHILEIFRGRIDDEYILQRKRVAKIHVHIGLSTKWYLTALQNLEDKIRLLIVDLPYSIEQRLFALDAFIKVIALERQLVIEEYEKVFYDAQQQQDAHVRQRVREQIGSVSLGLEQQVTQTNDVIQQLAYDAQQINGHMQHTMQSSQKTRHVATTGHIHMRALHQQTHDIHEQTIHMSTMVSTLNSSAHEIQSVVSIVQKIANQTNLLALNSAIEAARAGEAGKGFAVVADEVRKLAEQTSASATQIASLIQHSTTITSNVVGSIEQIQQLVEQGLSLNTRTLDSFEEITATVDTSLTQFEEVGVKIHQMDDALQQMESTSSQLTTAAAHLERTISSF